MKAQKIEIAVEATITDESAQRCLRLLEMYLDDNWELNILDSYRQTATGVERRLEFVHAGGNGENAERWMPVTEQLPEEEGQYLVFCKGKTPIEVGRFYIDEDGERYFGCDWSFGEDVKAWMPLPEPYKGGAEE